MSDEWHQQEGIVLWHGRHGERGHVLHLLTAEEGIVHLYFRQAIKSREAAIDDLIRGEFIYREGKGDLKDLREWKPLEYFDKLRGSYKLLEQATAMMRALRRLLQPDFPFPKLYRLTRFFLNQLPEVEVPELLTASFYLRLLRHEGLLQLPFRCHHCQTILSTFSFDGKEMFCQSHSSITAITIDEEQAMQWEILTACQQLDILKQMNLSPEQIGHISRFFDHHCST